MARANFREQMLKVREDAIVSSVNRLLAQKGFDLMTVDEVAADVGIAKASLYKHFASKEALASAAMVRVLERGAEVIGQQAARAEASAMQRLQEVTRWVLGTHLSGQMPTLPSQNSTLRAELLGHKRYLELLLQVSEQLGAWIVQAQADGAIDRSLPPELVLYTLYARACDPVPLVLKAGGRYTHDEIVDLVLRTCFAGLAGRPS
ncbi:MAG: TetR/AcrR family transcriptional regulator [Rubrivivax sp.]